MYVAPKMVSGRVVNTRITGFSASMAAGAWRSSATFARAMGNSTSAPSLRPIQFSCALRVVSDQSIHFRLSRRRPA